MTTKPPFTDPETGSLDYDRVVTEAVPIAKLVALFAVVALVPFALSVFPGGTTIAVLLSQFVLAVGTGVTLLYVIVRAMQISEEVGGDEASVDRSESTSGDETAETDGDA
jgi:hypothetical protein